MKSVAKKAIAAALAIEPPGPRREALEIRRDGAPQATAGKVEAMLAYRDPRTGRVHHVFRFCAAATHRWSSHGPQVHNMRRVTRTDIEALITAVRSGDIERVHPLGSPFAVLGEVARPLIRAAPGKRLLIGDLRSIEPRVLAFLAGDRPRLEDFRAFDAGSGHDIYVLEYCRVFGVRPAEVSEGQRNLAKTLTLALGYQGGLEAFKKIAPEDHGFTDQQIIGLRDRWRAANPLITRLWYSVYRAACDAVRHPGHRIKCGHLTFESDDAPFLIITLPSGSQLFYPHARFVAGRERPYLVAKDNAAGRWIDTNLYGGKLVDHVTQSTARDVLAAGMLRLEGAGYPIITTTHDEIVAEVEPEFGTVDEFARLMTAPLAWAPALPLAAKVATSINYTK